MPVKNKKNNTTPQPDAHVSRNEPGNKQRNQTNNSNVTGEINRGNTMNIGSNQVTNELHTKKTITGSDNDGQAE